MTHLPFILRIDLCPRSDSFWSARASFRNTLTLHCATVPMLSLPGQDIEDPISIVSGRMDGELL